MGRYMYEMTVWFKWDAKIPKVKSHLDNAVYLLLMLMTSKKDSQNNLQKVTFSKHNKILLAQT